MKYTAENGYMIESQSAPVTYNCKLSSEIRFIVGTFKSLETSSTQNGDLQQIEIIRTYDEEGNLFITVIEQTPEQIQEYLYTINI